MSARRPPLLTRGRLALRSALGRKLGYRQGYVFDWLRPGDIAIDCGANVGKVTALMRARGATVHAVEPDPVAFAALTERFAADPGVILHNAAVGTEAGTARLYFARGRVGDPVAATVSSSLYEGKSGIDASASVDVEVLDLGAMVERLGAVAMVKIDIEGHEVEVVPNLLARGLHRRIGLTLVETHERKSPMFAQATARMKDAARQSRARGVLFNWR